MYRGGSNRGIHRNQAHANAVNVFKQQVHLAIRRNPPRTRADLERLIYDLPSSDRETRDGFWNTEYGRNLARCYPIS